MEKPNLTPAIIISAALIVSSLILSYSMFRLGDDIVAAGIYSRKISLSSASGTSGVRVILDDKSQLKIESEAEPGS